MTSTDSDLAGAIVRSLDSRFLDLIVLPTEQCNLRCSYCYEDFTIGSMASETVWAVKHLITTRARDLDTLFVNWFGGEPLLRSDIVLDVSRHARDEMGRHGGSFEGVITTNATQLTLALATELADSGVRTFHVTLDGWGDFHDSYRHTRNGRGSFERILANLESLHTSDLPVTVIVRMHYRAGHLDDASEATRRLGERFGGDRRFELYFKAISRLGGTNDGEITPMSKDEKVAAERWLSANGLGGLTPSSADPHVGMCYAAMANSFVVRANGRIGKCTVALDDPANDLGRLLPDGTLELDQPKLRHWLRGVVSRDAAELACPLAAGRAPADGTSVAVSVPVSVPVSLTPRRPTFDDNSYAGKPGGR